MSQRRRRNAAGAQEDDSDCIGPLLVLGARAAKGKAAAGIVVGMGEMTQFVSDDGTDLVVVENPRQRRGQTYRSIGPGIRRGFSESETLTTAGPR